MSKKQLSLLDAANFEKIRDNMLGAIGSCLKTLKCSLKRFQNCYIIKTISRLVLVDKFRTVRRSENGERIMTSDAKKFDWSIKQRLSDLLQKIRQFQLDDELLKQVSFACVVQDRLKDAIEYLDAHLEPPRNRNELYLFMVYADNVFSAVEEFFKLPLIKHKVENPYDGKTQKEENSRFFKDVFKKVFPHISEDKIPTDDNFFKYFRALSFAHPYETSRQKFIDKKGGEIHYSPFPLVRSDTKFPVDADGDIGIAVYSNGLGKNKTPTYFNIILKCSTI